MLPMVLFSALVLGAPCLPPSPEPDGSHTLGVVPPYHGSLEPPDWLRATSHALVALHCRHYLYEAYGDGCGAWLVRYVAYPGEGETAGVREQVLLFPPERRLPPEALAPLEVRCQALRAVWHERTFVLADRRDLMK